MEGKCCTEVCPEFNKITDNAIIPLTERVVDIDNGQLGWREVRFRRRSAVVLEIVLVSISSRQAQPA
jgi:hypothetical protein